MAKKETLKNGDLRPDDDLNIPDFDFGSPEVKDDRKPAKKILDSGMRGARDAFSNPGTLGKLLKSSLPKEYGDTLGTIDSAASSIKDGFNEAVSEVRPAAAELARSVDKLVPESAKRTKDVLKRISNWGDNKSVATGPSAAEQRDASIGAELTGIFKDQATQAVKDEARRDAKEKINDALSFTRHKDQMGALNQIASDTSKSTQYLLKVTSAYQKKSLELQFRSYFAQVDMLESLKQLTAITRPRLDAIQKNTGLPDFVKMKMHDTTRQHLRQKAFSGITNMLGDRSNFIGGMIHNVKERVNEVARGVSATFGAAAMGSDMAGMMQDMSTLDGSDQATFSEIAAQFGAEEAVKWLAGKLGKKVNGVIKDPTKAGFKQGGLIDRGAAKIRKGAAYLSDFNADQEAGIMKLLNVDLGDETAVRKALTMAQNFLKSAAPVGGPDTRTQTDQISTARDILPGFTNLANKSITEIIPGYLARILREIYVMRTQDEKAGLIDYDMTKNKFTSSSKNLASIRESLVPKSSSQNLKNNLDSKIREIDTEGTLTEAERHELAKMLLRDNLDRKGGSPDRLSKAQSFTGPNAGKFSALFQKHFGTDHEGKVVGGDTEESLRKSAEFKTWFKTVGSELENPSSKIQDFINAGQLERLRETGLVNEEGTDLNYDKLIEMAMGKTMGSSDQRVKRKVKSFKPKDALEGIRRAESKLWNYKEKTRDRVNKNNMLNANKQALGPMAQDVHREFGEGAAPGGDKIDLVSMNGIAMSAINGLDQKIDQIASQKGEGGRGRITSQIEQIIELLSGISQNIIFGNRVSVDAMIRGGMSPQDARDYLKSFKFDRGDNSFTFKDDSILGRFANIGKNLFGLGKDVYGLGKAGAMSAYQTGKDKAYWAWDKAEPVRAFGQRRIDRMKNKMNKQIDLYVEGEVMPRLSAVKLQNGDYRDKETGKVIKTASDIRGDVVDENGNIVIDWEDTLNLYVRNNINGKFEKAKDYLRSKYDALKFHAKDKFNRAFNTGNIWLNAGKALANKLRESAKDVLDGPRDIYVRGESKPRLLGIVMGRGGYRLKTSNATLRRPSEINDEVLDQDNKTLISLEDLKTGLHDEKGHPLATSKQKLLAIGLAGAKFAYNKLKDMATNGITRVRQMMPFASAALGQFGDRLMDTAGKGLGKVLGPVGFGRNTKLLEEIRDILKERLPKAKKAVLGDTDGDGIREGSWQDKEKEEKEAAKNAKPKEGREKAKATGYGNANIFDTMAEKAKEAKDGIKSLLGLGGDAAEAAGGLPGKAGKAAGKGGILRRGGAALGRGAWGATKLAGRAAWGLGGLGLRALPWLGGAAVSGASMLASGAAAAASGIGAAASAVGSGIAAAAPILGTIGGAIFSVPGALVIGGALLAYGGYKVYKYLTKKKFEDLDLLRMCHYGLRGGDEEYHQKVYELEQMMSKYVTYDGNVADLKPPKDGEFNPAAVAKIFDVNKDDEEAMMRLTHWLQNRFKAVYLCHLSTLKMVADQVGIEKIEKLTVDQKLDFLNKLEVPTDMLDDMVSPFQKMPEFTADSSVCSTVLANVRKKLEDEKTKGSKDKKSNAVGEEKADNTKAIMASGSALALKTGTTEERNNAIGGQGTVQKAVQSNVKQPDGMNAGTTTSVASDPAGYWLGSNVSALEAVRFRTYGLKEMDANKVISLRALELMVGKAATAAADGSVSWTGDVQAILKDARKYYGIPAGENDETAQWTLWFLNRFLPSYTAYLSVIFRATAKRDQKTAEMVLKGIDAVAAANRLTSLQDEWAVTAAAWPGYEMNTDVSSTSENVAFLKKFAEEEKLREDKLAAQQAAKGTAEKTTEADKAAAKQRDAADLDMIRKARQQGLADKQDGGPDAEKVSISSGAGGSPSGGALSGLPVTAPGELAAGNGADAYLRLAPKATLKNVNPAFLKLFRGAVQEYGEKTGKTVYVKSGFRTKEEQQAEYDRNPKGAAKPGSSLHEVGLALDVDPSTLNEMDKMGLLRKYGLTRPVGGEPWHMEPAGIQLNVRGYRADPNSATDAIMNGVGKGGGGFGTDASAVKFARNPEMAKALLTAGAGAPPTESSTKVGSGSAVPLPGVPGTPGKSGVDASGILAAGTDGEKKPDMASKAAALPAGSSASYGSMAGAGRGSGYDSVKDVLADAAKVAGVDHRDTTAIAAIESGFDPNAKSKSSTATGLFQFTKGTWDDMLRKYGAQYGIPENTPPTDPKANALMGALYARDNKKALQKVKGDVNSTDLYMAHFLGTGGATRFFGMDKDAIAANKMPEAAAKNRTIFYKPDGTPRTNGEIYDLMNKKVNTAFAKHGVSDDSFQTASAGAGRGSASSYSTSTESDTGWAGNVKRSDGTTIAFNDGGGFMKTSYSPSGGGLPTPFDDSPPPRADYGDMMTARQSAVIQRNNEARNAPPEDVTRKEILLSSNKVESLLQQSLDVQTASRDYLGQATAFLERIAAILPASQDKGQTNSAPAAKPVPYTPDRTPKDVIRTPVNMRHMV